MANFEKAFIYKIISQKPNKTIIQPLRIVAGTANFSSFLSTIPPKEHKYIKFFLTHKQAIEPDCKPMTLKQAIKKYGIKLNFE